MKGKNSVTNGSAGVRADRLLIMRRRMITSALAITLFLFSTIIVTIPDTLINASTSDTALSSAITPLIWSYEIEIPSEEIVCSAISDDGNYVVIGTGPYWVESGVYLFSKESNIPLMKYPVNGVWSVAISADGSYIAVGAHPLPNPKIYLFNKFSSTPLWSYSPKDIIDSIAISGDGNYIVAAELGGVVGETREAYLFHKSSGTPLWTCTIGGGIMHHLDISEDGSYLVISGLPGLGFFHKSSNIPLWTSDIGVYSVSMSKDGSYIAVGFGEHVDSYKLGLYLFHKSSSTPLWCYSAEYGEAATQLTTISGDGQYIVLASCPRDYEAIFLFHKNSNTPLWSFEKHYEWTIAQFSSISISDDGNHIATTEAVEGKLYLFNKENNETIWTYEAGLVLCCISGDGNYIAASGKSMLYLFDAAFQVPSEVWVDDDYTPGGFNGGHTWGYDAFDQIQDGVDVLWGGGTVHVASGTYYETAIYRTYDDVSLGYIAVFISKNDLRLIGEDPSTTIIDSDKDATRIFVRGNGCMVNNLTIRNSGSFYDGIFLWQLGGNIITNNKLVNNDDGIHLSASNNNIIKNNVIVSNGLGINIEYSSENTIAFNTIIDNDFGIYLREARTCDIYHNNIIDNAVQASDDNPANNEWHHPVLLEGNYWSDYTGVDDGSGTGKHAIAGDGIGDTDIPWPDTDYDFYPFVEEIVWAISPPTLQNQEKPWVGMAVGDYGDTVTVTGVNGEIPAGTEVILYWDSIGDWDGEKGYLNETKVKANGNYEVWFDVPEAVNGSHHVWVKSVALDVQARSKFDVVQLVKLSASSGRPSDMIAVDGYGFAKEKDVAILFHSLSWPNCPDYETVEVLTIGDGVRKTFSGTLDKNPIRPGTLTVTDGVETFTDGSNGRLTGSAGGTGTINYVIGEYEVTFNMAPSPYSSITATYRYFEEIDIPPVVYILSIDADTNTLGSFQKPVEIPTAIVGPYNITAYDGNGSWDDNGFNIELPEFDYSFQVNPFVDVIHLNLSPGGWLNGIQESPSYSVPVLGKYESSDGYAYIATDLSIVGIEMSFMVINEATRDGYVCGIRDDLSLLGPYYVWLTPVAGRSSEGQAVDEGTGSAVTPATMYHLRMNPWVDVYHLSIDFAPWIWGWDEAPRPSNPAPVLGYVQGNRFYLSTDLIDGTGSHELAFCAGTVSTGDGCGIITYDGYSYDGPLYFWFTPASSKDANVPYGSD